MKTRKTRLARSPSRRDVPQSNAQSMGSAQSDVAGIVKWVVPSIGALATIFGFVSESAHQGLLGMELGDLGVRAYVWSAAQFLREIVSTLATAWFEPGFFVPEWSPLAALQVFSLVLLAVVALHNRLVVSKFVRPMLRSPHLALILLFLLSVWRIGVMDLPLTRLENLLGRGSTSIENTLKQSEKASIVERGIVRRATEMFELTVCSRVSSRKFEPRALTNCSTNRNYKMELMRIFLFAIGLSSCFILTACMLWKRLGFAAVILILTPLTFQATLAPAYLYGKLIQPTNYDSGLVQLRTDVSLTQIYSTKTIPSAMNNPLPEKFRTAIILAENDKFLTLYVNQPKDCPDGAPVYEWVPWRVAISEVVLIRDIATLDVVEERIKQSSCPQSPIPT